MELSTSGAMYHGVPSRPRSSRGLGSLGSKKAARPKSTALSGARASSDRSMKLPGLTSRWRIPAAWHCARVRSTARMYDAAVRSE